MAGLQELDLGSFNNQRYSVVGYSPNDADFVHPDGRSLQISQEILQLAAGIRRVHHRIPQEIGAEALAKELMKRRGTFYMVHDLADARRSIAGYSYVEPRARIHPHTVRASSLEAFNDDEGQYACRVVAATALYSMLKDNPWADTLRIDGRVRIPEGRGEDFFRRIALHPGSSRQWGEPSAYMVGNVAEVQERILSHYDIEQPVPN